MGRHKIEYIAVDDLVPADRNAKEHAEALIGASLSEFGYIESIVMDDRTGQIVGGHGRRDGVIAARDRGDAPPDGVVVKAGKWLVPVERGWQSRDDAHALAAGIALNRIGERGGWDPGRLFEDLDSLPVGGALLAATGFDDEYMKGLRESLDNPGSASGGAGAPAKTLSERFLVPPFSVLDARRGVWQDRKRGWLARGFRSELGRPQNLLNMSEQAASGYGSRQKNTSMPRTLSGGLMPTFYEEKAKYEAEHGETTTADFEAVVLERMSSGAYGATATVGPDGELIYETTVGLTSIFDPVLCEIAYRWFSGPKARVLDPFAGGSVRGLMAAFLGREYVGIDLRAEQVAENKRQAKATLSAGEPRPKWLRGNSADAAALCKREKPFDLLFSCPPYFNLEQYSDDPADLSNAGDWAAFGAEYSRCLAAASELVADDRFAVLVVGNVRDDSGALLDLVGQTRAAMEACGWAYYNDAVLVTAVGSLALRAARNFLLRKLGRTHQYVLVFVRGDVARAVEACGPVDVPTMEELMAVAGIDAPADE